MPDLSGDAAYDHVWRSRTHLTDRVGQTLRVLIAGPMNSALVEFEDGHRCVTSCFGYRRIAANADRFPPVVQTEQG